MKNLKREGGRGCDGERMGAVCKVGAGAVVERGGAHVARAERGRRRRSKSKRIHAASLPILIIQRVSESRMKLC